MAARVSVFRAARKDRQVRGLAVYIQDAQFGLARAQELRRQFMALRRAGKFVECYVETAGEGSNGTLVYLRGFDTSGTPSLVDRKGASTPISSGASPDSDRCLATQPTVTGNSSAGRPVSSPESQNST